ncbi:MAG: EVE domain-containing protein [Ignavibacteriae bacterium]|nr:MAG: EVE domain-containing protein [Ignavibacteriota bacterium]
MNYWLLKTEPSVYSFDMLEKDKQTIWDGVTSPGGLFQIKQVRKGDLAFIYHTGDERHVVGIGEIISNPYIDPKSGNPKHYVFDVKPKIKLKRMVSLEEIRANKKFKDSRLLKEQRLSVQPMPEDLWNLIIEMGNN